MELTIIIVTYQNEHEISHCLSSLNDAIHDFSSQLIIIDNNSKDHTKKIVDKQIADFKHHLFIQNSKNEGFTKAVNQGLQLVDSNYILLLNPDTELPSNTLKKLLPIFESYKDVGIVSPQFINTDGSIQPSCRRFPKHRDVFFHALGLHHIFASSKIFNGWKMGDFNHKIEQFVDQPQGAFLLTHRTALMDVGLLDEQFPMFFSDVDWCRRFIEKGYKIFFTPQVKIIHHKGRSIILNRAPLIWSSHISFYKYFCKYYREKLWFIGNKVTGMLLIMLAFMRIVHYKMTNK